jgi:small subunit ribosomal protein S9
MSINPLMERGIYRGKNNSRMEFKKVLLSPIEWELALKMRDCYIVMLVTNAGTREARIQRIINPISNHIAKSKVDTLQQNEINSGKTILLDTRIDQMPAHRYFEGIGRRKTSTARVRITPNGSGGFFILRLGENGKFLNCDIKEQFPRQGDFEKIIKPLTVAGYEGQLDVSVRVSGGGISGQVSAIQLGLARALILLDPTLRPVLRAAGLLTRDPRSKERKKPGLKQSA